MWPASELAALAMAGARPWQARCRARGQRQGGPTASYEEGDEEGRPQDGSPLLLLLRTFFVCAFDAREGQGREVKFPGYRREGEG
jgi:hypothetical protein